MKTITLFLVILFILSWNGCMLRRKPVSTLPKPRQPATPSRAYEQQDSIPATSLRPGKTLPDESSIVEGSSKISNLDRAFLPVTGGTGGKIYPVKTPDQLIPSLIKAIRQYVTTNADVVFLIDRTGSMKDDIYIVKKSVERLSAELKRFPGVSVAIATYADRNHNKHWFSCSKLSPDFKIWRREIERVQIQDDFNPDIPESVYDAIYSVVEKIKWKSPTKRIILVIGDAPPQTGSFTQHSLEEVINRCKSDNIDVNVCPVLIE